MTDISIADRITGSLLGLAVGDALGAPLESLKDGHILQLFGGEVNDYADSFAAFPDRPGKWRLKGLYTDDTQQALAVAEILAVHGRMDLRALADLYIRLADEGPAEAPFGAHRGVGHIFRRAVGALRETENPLAAGQPSAGNGAAMRVAPVGLFYADDEEALARAAIEVSLMTHHDPRGVAAALAVARAVAWFVQGNADPLQLAKELPEWVYAWEQRLDREYAEYLVPEKDARLHQFSEALKVLPSLLREENHDLAVKTIIRVANESDPETPIAQAHDAFALASVVMALYRAFSARDFFTGMVAAINAGGDTDTVAAIVGAILGARFGVGAIPAAWLQGLLNAGQVRERARALHLREVDWTNWEDLVAMECALTEKEQEMVDRRRGENKRVIEKREQRQSERRQQAQKAAAKKEPQEPGFAPPPEIWLGKTKASHPEREEYDPIQAKKEKALRGKKRIAWKEDRRNREKE